MGRKRSGFTIVELLVSVAIVAILIAMLMPAVQFIRERARQTQCLNNMRQIGMGWLAHESQQGTLPAGGWTVCWTGDPDRGFGREQPGGWPFQTLPYIEGMNTFLVGTGLDFAQKQAALLRQKQSANPIFYCPTRRPASPYFGPESSFNSIQPPDNRVAKTDYVSNGGSRRLLGGSQPDLTCLNQRTVENCSWLQGTQLVDLQDYTKYSGVSINRYPVRLNQIRDGAAFTLMLGEKGLRPQHYTGMVNCSGDNNTLYQGWDWDTTRWVGGGTTWYLPMPDSELWTIGDQFMERFGSAHADFFNIVLCDGSLRSISYSINFSTWNRIGARADGGLPDQL